jgi:hypothetical protein
MAKSKKMKSDSVRDLKPRKVMDAGKAASVRGGTDEAASVRGGRKAGKGQQEFLIVKMNDVIITSVT